MWWFLFFYTKSTDRKPRSKWPGSGQEMALRWQIVEPPMLGEPVI
jgi:hypothetical protein